MAQNPKLLEVVLTQLNAVAQEDPGFANITEGDPKLGKATIESMGQIQVDKSHKLRFGFSSLIGYAYDFKAKCDEGNPEEIYKYAVAMTRKMKGQRHVEQFVKKGIEEKRYGWYITRIPK